MLSCAVVGSAQQHGLTPARSEATATQDARSYLFVSPNTRENLTLREALRMLNSLEELALILEGRRLACRLELKARIVRTIGSWTDGAEHSTMLLVRADEETVRYADAWLGRRGRQKSVLYFQQRAGGAALMYVLSLRGNRRSLALTAKTLDRNGVSDRTLVPIARGTLIYVVDLKGELRQRIAAAARQLRARYRVLEGTGDFIGDENRDRAQQVFSEIIEKYEQEHPPMNRDCGPMPFQTQIPMSSATFKQAALLSSLHQF
ncbi:MAG: hypothetical protein ICV68_09140 [Pyrinomonadaceae bacterium]|nr:hypothetical protein [Pyrinomonadaceae bacterium]